METLINRGSSSTADMKIDHNNSRFSIRNFLYDPDDDVPDQLIHFLIKQKSRIPICTALISPDLKTLHFISQAIFKLDVDAYFKKNETAFLTPYEIIKARLYLTPESTIRVQILSILLRNNLRFCLIFNDDLPKSDQEANTADLTRKRDYTFTFVKLTPREKQVARIVAFGKTSVQVSEELNIAIDTVKNHRKNIRRKLNIATRAEQIKVNEWLRNIHAENQIVY